MTRCPAYIPPPTLLTLVFKIVLVTGFLSLIAWIVIYTAYQPWWKDQIGRTLVIKTALIAGMFIPSILALFFHLNRSDSVAAGWIDVMLIGAVTPVMLWRIMVWRNIHQQALKTGPEPTSPGP